MKTLIISDDASVIEKLDLRLQKSGYDTIIYRWLLKALDNLEEISPDFIIVSTADYPRHWKTLASFVQANLARVKAEIILFVPAGFSEDEKKKAAAVGIKGTFNNLEENGLSELESLLGKKSELIPSEKKVYGETENASSLSSAFSTDIKKKSSGLLSKIQAMYE